MRTYPNAPRPEAKAGEKYVVVDTRAYGPGGNSFLESDCPVGTEVSLRCNDGTRWPKFSYRDAIGLRQNTYLYWHGLRPSRNDVEVPGF
jgi:hypothetical protein